jgi:hypothetical protein
VIIDLPRFIAAERPSWTALEKMLDRMETSPTHRMTLGQARQFHLLYQKVSADLARIATFAAEPELRRYLESLTARAYAEVHETRERGRRFAFVLWFTEDFPIVFRTISVRFSVPPRPRWSESGWFSPRPSIEAKGRLPGNVRQHLRDPANCGQERKERLAFAGSTPPLQ